MITHDFLQSSPDWHRHRATHFNASDAPAMLGISQYKTRSHLLREMATSITPEIDAATQSRFDAGHRFEALARPLAEQIIGKKLYPVIGSEGKLSASFDGLTADDSAAFEHKTLNNGLRDALSAGEIPEQYRAQMEQQLMLSGAGRCLFMASSWNDADELIEEMHLWYESDQTMRDRLLQGWTQFSIDLENYQHVEQAAKPQAEAIMDLPALSVQATGMVTHSNLPEFKAAAEHYIANINTKLETDQQFADAEATVKFCKATEEKLEVTKAAILAQTATIDEVIRTVNYIQEQLSKKRLMLDRLVKSEKEARKLAIVSNAGIDFLVHVEHLERETHPIQLNIPRPDFAGAIKGMKKLSAMQEEVDTVLRNGKFTADQIAKDIRAKMLWIATNAEGMAFLFPDLQQIITKPMDDFTLLIQSRIKDHKDADAKKAAELIAKVEAEAAAKLEAERVGMQQVEEAKAQAKVEDEQRAAQQAAGTAAKNNTPPIQASAHREDQASTLSHLPLDERPVAKPDNVVAIEHQDEISAFLASRDFGKEAGKVRAILVEFIKFREHFNSKRAA